MYNAEEKRRNEKTLRRMWAAGASMEDICKAIGRKTSAVYIMASRLKLPRRAPPGRKAVKKEAPKKTREPQQPGKRVKVYKKPEHDLFEYAASVVDRPPPTTKRRCCLRCGESFSSSWAGNRVCGPCKNRPDWAEDPGHYNVVCA